MAQLKISELNEDTVPTANDVMPVTDAETNITKKVKLSNLPISNATQSALDTTNSNLSSLSATVATNDSNAVHKTGNETISGIKIISGEVNGNLKVNTPQGHMLNGKIVTSVSGGNLTVAIKTLAGNDPSTADPVYVRIGNTVRTLTSTLSASATAGANWLNLSSAELQNQETDIFVYLVWNATSNGVYMFYSRIPYGRTIGDFVISGTDEKGVGGFNNPSWNSTDEVEVIGRFNAILSNTNTWSIPATSVIINRPIFETRRLNYNAQWSSSGTQPSIGNGSISSSYQVVMNRVNVYIKQNNSTTTTYGTGNYQWSLPFVYFANLNLVQIMSGCGVFYNGTSFPIIPHNNYYFSGSGVSWTSTKDTITGGVCSSTNPTNWSSGNYFGFGWQYDI